MPSHKEIKSKFDGIDERDFKCCCDDSNCIESGLSFDYDKDEKVAILRFHYLDYYDSEKKKLRQETKSMIIDKKMIKELIVELKMINCIIK